MNGARILVIRLSSIGDIVLTTPVLRALKTQLEGETEVHYFTKKAFEPIIAANPHVDHVHTLGENLTKDLDELEKIDFDYVIDLHKNYRSSLIKKRLKTLHFTVDKANFQKWMMVNLRQNKTGVPHIVDRYMATLNAFGVTDDKHGLDYIIPKNEMVNPRALGLEGRYLAVAVGANHDGKVIPMETLEQVIQGCKSPVALLGDQNDHDRVPESLNQMSHVANLCGKLSINQSASVVAQSEVVLAGDTGLMHIAAAFSKKIVSIWGCTSPLLGMYPYRAHDSSVMVEPNSRSRRPCSKLGNRCKYGSQICISTIPAGDILNPVLRLLDE